MVTSIETKFIHYKYLQMRLSHTRVLIKWFWKVKSPSKPSTYFLLSVIVNNKLTILFSGCRVGAHATESRGTPNEALWFSSDLAFTCQRESVFVCVSEREEVIMCV